MLWASFAKPAGIFDNFFNKAVSWITGGEYCHSEFIFQLEEERLANILEEIDGHTNIKENFRKFSENNTVNLCFYVLWGDIVSYRFLKETHNNPFYRMPNDIQYTQLHIDIDHQKELDIMKFLLQECGKFYDYTGALAYFVPWRNQNDTYDKYFCSQLMLTAMQKIDMYTNHNPASITPNQLYKIIKT